MFIPAVEPITIGGITISLEDGKIGIGKSTSLTVEATGTNPVYKWFKSGKPLVESTFYKGTTKATLHIEEVTADLTGDYWCEVSNVKSPKKVPTSSQVFLDVSKSEDCAFLCTHHVYCVKSKSRCIYIQLKKCTRTFSLHVRLIVTPTFVPSVISVVSVYYPSRLCNICSTILCTIGQTQQHLTTIIMEYNIMYSYIDTQTLR